MRRLPESWWCCCKYHWGFVSRTSERTLDDYLKFFSRATVDDLILALLYAVHVSDWTVMRSGTAVGAAGSAMTALGVWAVGSFCVDAVLVWLFARYVRNAADGPSVRAEQLGSVITWKRVCVGHACAGLALCGARFLLEMWQFGFVTAWAAFTLVLILLAKAAGVMSLGSFGRWLRLQSREAEDRMPLSASRSSSSTPESDEDLQEEDERAC